MKPFEVNERLRDHEQELDRAIAAERLDRQALVSRLTQYHEDLKLALAVKPPRREPILQPSSLKLKALIPHLRKLALEEHATKSEQLLRLLDRAISEDREQRLL
jgi:hypothetical protein